MIRIGTFNTGNFSGNGVPAGSEKAKEVFREVINSDNVELWGLQEDISFFNPETGEMPYEAIYSDYNRKLFLQTYLLAKQNKFIIPAIISIATLGFYTQGWKSKERTFVL